MLNSLVRLPQLTQHDVRFEEVFVTILFNLGVSLNCSCTQRGDLMAVHDQDVLYLKLTDHKVSFAKLVKLVICLPVA